jgi:hypothetical protein
MEMVLVRIIVTSKLFGLHLLEEGTLLVHGGGDEL